jgi:sialic acid synthase SpsE
MYIIAEIGSNCFKTDNESYNLNNALRQIELAGRAKASAVKFQYFTSQDLFGEEVEGVEKVSMPRDWLPRLKQHCDAVDIDFMCSAFSIEGFLEVDPYVEMHKLASPELYDKHLREWLFKNTKPIMFSLGCCPTEDHKIWLDLIRPTVDVAMECVSKYPATMYDYDLLPMYEHMKTKGISWGLSDHTLGFSTALQAKSLGASVFEKHVDFLFDQTETPDRSTSINGKSFAEYCKEIRTTPARYTRPARYTSDELKRQAKAMYARIANKDDKYYRPVKAET